RSAQRCAAARGLGRASFPRLNSHREPRWPPFPKTSSPPVDILVRWLRFDRRDRTDSNDRETTMSIRRSALASLATCFVLTLSSAADAGDYPLKALRLIVPFPPGAGTDMFGRTIAQKLQEY